MFGGDLNLGALIQRDSLRDIDPTHQQARVLASTDIKATKKFLSDLQRKQDGHNIGERMRNLYNRCAHTNRCSAQDADEFQKICKQMNQNAQQAETNCKVVGKWPWSNILASAGQAMQLAGRELRELLQGAPSGTCLADRESAIARAKHNVAQATEIRDAILTRASDLRETDLELQAEAEASRNNTTKANVIKAILRREREAGIFSRLRFHISGKSFNQLDELLTPDDPNDVNNCTWTAVVNRQAMWEVLLHQGREHFSQARDTPFATGPIANLIGPFDDNEYSEKILEGNFDIDSLVDSLETRDLVKAMAYRDTPAPSFNCELTVEELRDGFKAVKESTASSPGGLHYGIWKTLISDETIFEPFALMIIFAFRWSVVPVMWEKVVQIILAKDVGQRTKITRIRRVQLLDAGLNMGFRILFGHRMLQAAKKLGVLSDLQFGARSGYMCISCVLLKRLSYDIIRQL
jgi:hypothetical protein